MNHSFMVFGTLLVSPKTPERFTGWEGGSGPAPLSKPVY